MQQWPRNHALIISVHVSFLLVTPPATSAEPLQNFSLKRERLKEPQGKLDAWSFRNFPDPLDESDENSCVRSILDVLHFCDPEQLLKSSKVGDQWGMLEGSLQAFAEQFNPSFFGATWGVRLGVALLSEVKEATLARFATGLAERWKLTGDRDVLLVLAADGGTQVAVNLGSGLRKLPLLSDNQMLRAAERQATGLMRDGQFAAAALVLVRHVAGAVSGTYLHDQAFSGQALEQRNLAQWKGPYQDMELWENNCAERRCLELFLDNVRQLSERYESYYHEAMVYPALNVLGPERARRVLILGAGDGGIATYTLKYKSITEVIVVELDEEVVRTSQAYFPAISAGYQNPKCKLILTDAFAWVSKQAESKAAGATYIGDFDAIIIDFTDEPVEGAFSNKFYSNLKLLMHPHGVLMQNMGTIFTNELKKYFSSHIATFKKVYPLNMFAPDYVSPYFLAFSTDELDPMAIDPQFLQRIDSLPKYYSNELQEALLTQPADFLKLFVQAGDELQKYIPGSPGRPLPLPKVILKSELDRYDESDDYTIRIKAKRSSLGQALSVRKTKDCETTDETCHALLINTEYVFSHTATEAVLESYLLPAMNILGKRAKRLLVLGGGSGSLVRHALRFPSVEHITLVEIDKDLVELVTAPKNRFPSLRTALADSRVEVIVENAFEFLTRDMPTLSTFDLILVDLSDETWRPASVTSRVPRFIAFYERLRQLLNPHGLVVQDVGSLATWRQSRQLVELHQAAFEDGSTWVMNFAKMPDNLEQRQKGNKTYALDTMLRRPPRFLAISSPTKFDPCSVDWLLWQSHGFDTEYYHASLHRQLFVLPAEVQRYFGIPQLPSSNEAGLTASAKQHGRQDEL